MKTCMKTKESSGRYLRTHRPWQLVHHTEIVWCGIWQESRVLIDCFDIHVAISIATSASQKPV